MKLDKQMRDDRQGGLAAALDDDKPKKRPGGGGPDLPHRSEMERAFGVGLDDVNARVGADLGGKRGLAQGDSVAFADRSPDRKVVAHEIAHVLQTRGFQGKGAGAGKGDVESNASEIAIRADRGEQVGHLVSAQASGDRAHAYSESNVEGVDMRISENGKSMVSQDGGAGGQTLYATEDLIADANAKLGEAGPKGSFIRLKATGSTHKNGEHNLMQVLPKFTNVGDDPDNKKLTKANEKGGKDDDGKKSAKMMALWAQCGRSSKTVMGTDDYGDAAHAQYNHDGNQVDTSMRSGSPDEFSDEIYLREMPAFLQDAAHQKYLKENVHYSGDKTNLIEAHSPGMARKQFWELGAAGRLAFSKKVGINEFADPEIGGAYTMATEYDMPGYKPVNPDFTWNFHWAGVVMKDGSDNITLENYAIMFEPTGDAKKDAENAEKAYDWANRDWVYQMYGSAAKKGQTFQEQHLATGTHANRASTFAAKVD